MLGISGTLPKGYPTISLAAQVWCWEKLFKLPMAKLAWKVYLRRLEVGDGCCETPFKSEKKTNGGNCLVIKEWTPTF